jgi:hypothetical protein
MNPSSFLYFQSYTVGLSIPLRIKKIAGWITLGSSPQYSPYGTYAQWRYTVFP